MIDGTTRVCGLIGNPVSHTLSPLIHNELAARTGTNLTYLPFPVEESRTDEAVAGAFALGMLGLNVTVPHKSRVLPALAGVEPLAAKIGAVNTLVRTEVGFWGYNTDLSGLFRAMQSDGISLSGQEVILIGAGGAARAAAFLCAREGCRVWILNRSLPRAEALAKEVNAAFGKTQLFPLELKNWRQIPEGRYLAIQATSAGLYPHCEETAIEDPAFYEKISVGYDLIYRPLETRFMQLVRAHGGEAFHGLKMLLWQGIEAFELWNRVQISEETAEAVYELLLQKLDT